MPNQNKFDLSSFAPAEGDEVLVESTPRKKEGRFDLSLFPESARPKVQPPVPESPYDDSALATAKRIGGSLVEYGAGLPTGLHTTFSAVNRLIGRPLERIAGAFDPKLEQELRAAEAKGFETARKIREGAKEFSEKTLGVKPGTPITVANLKKESFGGKIGMLARGTAESVPVTLVNLGMTLLNPAVGTASIYLAETGGTRADLEELEKSGVKIDPAYKDIAAVGGGALKTALEKTGLESLVSKAPGVRSKVFNVLSSLLTEFRTEGVQELSDVLVEAGAKVSGNDSLKVFETFKTEIENNLPRLEEASIRGGLAGGAIRGGVEISRIPSERSVARQKQATEEESRAQEESRQAEEARSTREKLQVASERESLIDRLQKERDLEIGGPLIGVNEKGVRPIKTIDAELAQTTDSEVVRALQFERELAVERRAGEKRTPASPFVTGRKEGSEREYIISERKAGKKLSEVNAEIANRYQTFDEFMGDLPTGSRVLKNKRVFEKVGDKDWALVESGRVSPEKKIEERRLTDADIIKSFEPATIATPEAAAPPRPFSEELDRIIQPLQDEQAFRDFEREQGRAELSRAQDEMRRMSEPFITPEPDDVEVIPPVPKTRALPTGEIAPERRAIPPFTKRREFRVSEYGEPVAITSPEELQRAQALRNQAQAERMSQTAPTREVTGARFDLSDFKPAERTPERPATPIAKESVAPKPAVRLREIQEQFAAESGKTFDQLLPGQKAAATKKARAILFEELREAQKPKVEKPVVPTSEREIRAQTPAPPEANAKSFNTALDDFLKIEKETKGKPLSEQMTVAKQRLEEKGYHPAIVDELTNPERLKRPDVEGDLVEATTREGRIKRAVEPPPELKGRVDAVAKRTKEFRDAEADYLQARKDIFSEVEKLGGKIIAQGEDGTFKIEIKPGKTKLSMQDQLALVKLRQEAAEAGAYSLATVGKGFEIAAAPLRIKQGETLKGDLNRKVSEFILRKKRFQDTQKAAQASKKALLDSYTDFYFKNKVEGRPNASLIGRAGDLPVEVQLRRKASSPVPDTAVIDPTTGKTWAERLRDERKEAQKRSEALGPQGEPFVETRKIGEAKAAELEKEGVSVFDYKRSLSTEELSNLEAAHARLDTASREFAGKLYSGPAFSPQIWKEYVEIGHLVAKGLARNLGAKAKITFENFKEAFKNAVGPDIFKRLESNLVHLWEQVKALPDDWESGDEVPTIVRAEAVENTPELSPSNVAKAERRFDFGLPLLDRLERSNSVGGEIGAKWRKAHGILKTTLGRNAVEIRKIAKEAGVRRDKTTPHLDVVSRQLGWEKKGANLLLVDLINHPERIKDYPLTEVEKKIISLYRSTYERNEKEIARRLGREPNPLKFQPTLNNEAREAIFVLKGGPLFEALAKATAERSGLELKKVKQKFASGNLSGLDIPTHVPLKGELIAVGSADAISALQAQNFEFARTLGLLRTFGPKWKNEIKNLREKYDQAGGDLEIFDLIEQGYRGLRPKDWISEKQSSRNLASRLYFRAVDPVFSALALSKSAYMQITQPFIDLQNVGVKNFMKTITEGFGGKLSADDLERMGIISRDILNWKFAEGEKIEDYGRMISGLVNRGDLMHAVSLLNDVVSASNWRNFINSLAAGSEHGKGKKLAAKDRQTLRTNLGLTDAEVQKVEQGKFKDPLGENPSTPEEEFFVEMVRRGKTQSQHTGKFGGEKSRFQTGSSAPFFLRFQNYTIGEFQRWRRETANLEKALKSGRKDERNAAIMRVCKLIGTTAVQGEFLNIIRHTIKGEWDEWEEGSGVAQALRGHPWQSMKNFMWNFAEAGFMGAFTRAYLSYQIAQGSATALMDAFFPTNIAHNVWDAVFSRGRYADKDKSERFLEFIESRVPATDLSKPLERAMALTALAKEDRIAMDVARRHYFKWLDDTGRGGEFPERSGYKESRASVARAYAAMKKGDDEDVLEALASAFQAKLEEGTPKKKKLSQGEALDLVKKSLKARMLLSRHKHTELEELKEAIGEERYNRLAHHDALLKHLANSLSISKLRTQTKE